MTPSQGSSNSRPRNGPVKARAQVLSFRVNERKNEPWRSGTCAVLGQPNAGKSTLLNHLLGEPLMIVANQPGTTRTNALGVFVTHTPPTQIGFLDTPGVGRAQTTLHRALHDQARQATSACDVTLLLVDASSHRPLASSSPHPLLALVPAHTPVVVALNKVDLLKDKTRLLPMMQSLQATHGVRAVVPVSARRGQHMDALVHELRTHLPDGQQYDNDTLTDKPMRFYAAEYIREAALHHLTKEVPYGVAVLIDRFARENNTVFVDATVVVEKESHKAIVIGHAGQVLKTIGTAARLRLQSLLGHQVMLKLWVRVDRGWTKNPDRIREYTHPK